MKYRFCIAVPLFSLKSFKRVSLWPGETKTVEFEITPDMLELVNEDGERVLENGEFDIIVGGACPTKRAQDLGAAKPVMASLTVR